mmetsp:Transcript_20715/g.29667  ORF Transcript_20715/g.29667 Transcript_20715/m.29667 type:complete len:111 (-) Transcript_20715:176-508(-)
MPPPCTGLVSSQDDLNAIDKQFKSLKVKARVYKMNPASCLSKYDVTNFANASDLALQLDECANVDSKNPAEIMAFNYVVDQIDIDDQGGADEVWNKACERMDEERRNAEP